MRPGRNDPCHCGSGLKYKKCHEATDPPEDLGHAAPAERCECCGKTGHKPWTVTLKCRKCKGRLEPTDPKDDSFDAPWRCSGCGAMYKLNEKTHRFRQVKPERAEYPGSR